MAAYLAYVYARWVCTFFQYVCFVFFGSALRVFEVKVLLYSCGLGAALMHTGIIITILMML
jgi:hypothetical protein